MLVATLHNSARELAAQEVRLNSPANKDFIKATPTPREDAGETIDRMITRLVLENMPHTYNEDKNWGKQTERFDGIKFRREGWKIETKRRRKKVNDGTWRRYSARLINPGQEFQIKVLNIRQTPEDRLAFDVQFVARLDLHGRQSKWIKGVQLYSLSADANAKVRLQSTCEMGIRLDITKLPPDIVFEPEVTKASLTIEDFRLHRVSKAGGEFAQQLTHNVRSLLDKKLKEKEQKLVTKINNELDKKKDRLRLSISEAISVPWAAQAKEHLPAPVRSALEAARRP